MRGIFLRVREDFTLPPPAPASFSGALDKRRKKRNTDIGKPNSFSFYSSVP